MGSRRGKISNIQNLLVTSPISAQRFTSRVVSELSTPVLSTLGPKPMEISTGEAVPSKKKLFSVEE